eukprot:2347410-Prymnesium_polylepis.1
MRDCVPRAWGARLLEPPPSLAAEVEGVEEGTEQTSVDNVLRAARALLLAPPGRQLERGRVSHARLLHRLQQLQRLRLLLPLLRGRRRARLLELGAGDGA